MSDDTIPNTPTTSDWCQAVTLPAGLADRLRGQVARIERAAEFLRNYDLAVPPAFAHVPIPPAAEAPKTEVDPGQIAHVHADGVGMALVAADPEFQREGLPRPDASEDAVLVDDCGRGGHGRPEWEGGTRRSQPSRSSKR